MVKQRIEFILVTFLYDLPQFYLLCLSIKKYHNKEYKIRVIYNYEKVEELDHVHKFTKIIQEHLTEFDTEFSIKPAEFNSNGWNTQQLLKWHLAYTSTADWQVVLDTKNFYIKPFKLLDTMTFEEIPGFEFPDIANSWIQQELDKSYNFLKNYQSEYPQKYSAMTPWIWSTQEVRNMLDTVWADEKWKKLKDLPGTEWFLYLAWIGNRIKYSPCQLVTGIWGNCDPGDEVDSVIFSEASSVHFWTIHRFANDSKSVNLTQKVLIESKVANAEEISYWLTLRSTLSRP